jgi:hypothetical protein
MAWRDLHHVEESLIDVADAADLERVFHHDRLRVNGSKLERNGSLVPDLIARAEEGFEQADRAAIRPVLRAIRTAVNDFRDRRFEGLVRSRMHVERVSLLLGLASWALLCLAILAGAGRVAVTGVAALYLIGAAAGLTTQLRSRAAESLEDVFGYGQAQLRQVVLMSGLAAVGGVFLTTMAGSTSAGGSPVDISGAFDFNGIAVLTAAAFGLAPGMLTDRIQGWAGRNLKDLESTTTEGAATQA